MIGLLGGPLAATFGAPTWQSSLTKDPPGNFPELRPVRTSYHFGWSGFTAGTGDMHFTKTADRKFQLEANGGSIDGPGPVVVDGILYVTSGNGGLVGRSGNVLLAFGVE